MLEAWSQCDPNRTIAPGSKTLHQGEQVDCRHFGLLDAMRLEYPTLLHLGYFILDSGRFTLGEEG